MNNLNREKGTILYVGVIDAQGRPCGWSFDGRGVVPAIDTTSDGEILISGYTSAELVEIASRREEWGE